MKQTFFFLLAVLSLSCKAQDTVVVRHHAYTTVFAQSAHIPVLVVYTLHKAQINCPNNRIPRTNRFTADPEVWHTALGCDYVHSGYDQGHNMSAQDNSCSASDMAECFYFTNMFPQLPQLNRGPWKALEIKERSWAMEHDSIRVYIGSYGIDRKIGPDSVFVPAYCWKIIYNSESGTPVSKIFANTPGADYEPQDMTDEEQKWASYLINKWLK